MALYIPRDIKIVKFDFTNVEIGESIFSKFENNKYTLCIKQAEDEWQVFVYEKNDIIHFNTKEPSNYIYSYNEVFDIDKTKWVIDYWEKACGYIYQLKNFNSRINNSFPY